MDPNACLRQIYVLIMETDIPPDDDGGWLHDELDYACEDLHAWLARGGFPPLWEDFPEAIVAYRSWCAEERKMPFPRCSAPAGYVHGTQ